MRLAVCTLSAVLLSGCSWLGYGGGYAGSSNSYVAGTNCGNAGAYGNQYAQVNYTGGCGGGTAYMANTYGANAYGTQTAMGLRGAQGGAGYGYSASSPSSGYAVTGANGYPAGGGSQFINGRWVAEASGTVLGGAAPYGSATAGSAGGQYASMNGPSMNGPRMNGQWSAGTSTSYGGSNVATVQGAPIYVQQPYPAYYGVGVASGGCGNVSPCGGQRSVEVISGCGSVSYACGGLRGGYAALPFGIEASIGTSFAIGGDIVGDKPGGPALGGAPGATLNTSGSSSISYGDAYKNAVNYGLAATYDIDPSTTILARIGYSKAKGERIRTGTIDDSLFVPAPVTVTTEDLYAQWSDLEQWTVEGGVRKYMGGWNNTVSGIRPYVQATAGFTHNNDVALSQDSATLMPVGSNVQPYIDAGWTPTASGTIGAEMQVGARTAIGVEAGIRWRDDLNTITQSEDRWSVPVKLHARVSF